MANFAARMMLAKNGKCFPLHLLRGSVFSASTNFNLQSHSNFTLDPRLQPQNPLLAQYIGGEETYVPANGYNTVFLQSRFDAFADLNRVELRGKSIPSEDEDEIEGYSHSDVDEFEPLDDDDDDDEEDADDDDEDDEVDYRRKK